MSLFFPSQVPESYSYTLTKAMESGLPIVATAIGALPERLHGHPLATLVAVDASAQAFNDALLLAAGLAVPVCVAPAGDGAAS